MTKNPISVLIRCDASPSLGMGHLSRCRVVADALRADHSCQVTFSVKDRRTREALASQGYLVFQPATCSSTGYGPWLKDAAEATKADVLVLDVRDDPPVDTLRSLKRGGTVLATIDDASPVRLLADLAFYPPSPQTGSMNWSGFSGLCHQGWEWVIVDRRFSQISRSRGWDGSVVLITMGGSDPQGLTFKAVKAIDSLKEDCEPWVVVGPHFLQQEELARLLAGCRKTFRVLKDVEDMSALMAQVNLAVASFGVTAFELAASGVPAVHLCLTADHACSASAMMAEGMAISLGVHHEVSPEQLAQEVAQMLADRQERHRMGDRARALIDGKGANRIAGAIVERVQGRV